MSNGYMKPDHADAFVGMPIKDEPRVKYPAMAAFSVICPLCKGHGGWHLRLAAYPAALAPRVAHCAQCNGWGWVKPGLDATCIHENGPARNIGRCYNEYACLKCGRKISIDSSD